ncbi:MAG: hypothetical protein Q9179_004355 [Wetmoreana sp. 5 TL-2023]
MYSSSDLIDQFRRVQLVYTYLPSEVESETYAELSNGNEAKITDIWSRKEREAFYLFIGVTGTDWRLLSKKIGTKSPTQIESYYKHCCLAKATGIESRARSADQFRRTKGRAIPFHLFEMSAALLNGVENSLERPLDIVSEGNRIPPSTQVLDINGVDSHPASKVTYTPTTYRTSKAKKGNTVHVCAYPECGKAFTRAEHRTRHEGEYHHEHIFRRADRLARGRPLVRPTEAARGSGSQRSTNEASSNPPIGIPMPHTMRPSTQSAEEAFPESSRPMAVPSSQPGILARRPHQDMLKSLVPTPRYIEDLTTGSDLGWK